MKWEDVSEDSRDWLMYLGLFEPTLDYSLREVKGWNGMEKVYLNSDELRKIAAAFVVVAEWLDKRALGE